jgi:pSer/pThr/pTyr-binding forkhead associated (FHA) protein
MKLNLESSSYAFELDEADAPVTLGRSDECTCVITEGNVSRKHAEVRCEKGNWTIADIGSRAGTLVNGKKIEGPTALSDGDVVRMGDQSFVITLAESNDMEALGARLAGGKVRQLIKTAAAKPKKKIEPKKKAAAADAEKSEKSESKNGAGDEASSKSEKETESDDGEEVEKAAKPAKRVLKAAPRKQKSSLAGFLTMLVFLGLVGVGGYYGYQYYQQQQQSKAAAAGNAEGGAAVNLPSKDTAVAFPAKEGATVVAPQAGTPEEEKPATPEPAPATPDAAPVTPEAKPDAKTDAPKAETPAEAPAADK